MIAFPSQEKGNALYTLHNRIFHLSDSGIESTNLSHFQFIHHYFWTGVSVWSYSQFIYHFYQTWSLQNSRFIYGVCKILNSFIRRGVFYQVLKSFSIYIKTWRSDFSFLSDLESRPQIIIFSNHFAMKRNPGLDSIPLLIIISSILSDIYSHLRFWGFS